MPFAADRIAELDPKDMLGLICSFPDHFADGWARAAVTETFGLQAADYKQVVVCGMGGSAIGGDLVRTFIEPTSPLAWFVVRGYDLPASVDDKTLVIISSYSGGTEETLSAFAQARERGATIVCVTSGGEVLRLAEENGYPHVVILGGMQPRAALGYSFSVLLRFARALGLVDLPDADLEAALTVARERVEILKNPAGNAMLSLAETVHGSLPVVYSGTGLLEAVNWRWRGQIQENAKYPAYGNLFAELDHNEIMGFEAAPNYIAKSLSVLCLRDRDDHPQIVRRMDITKGIIEPVVARWIDIPSEGETRIARLLSLLQLGDFLSYWIAMLQGVDPTPVKSIQRLKDELAQ